MSDQQITYKKPAKKKKAKKAKTLASKVAVLASRLPTPEIKYGTASITATQIDFNGTLNSLLGISQGAQGINQRQGDALTIKAMSFKYRAYITTSTAISMIRVMVFVDEQANLNVSNVMAQAGGVLAPLSFYNKEYRGRYRILYDKTHSLDPGQSYQDLADVKITKPVDVVFSPAVTTVRANDVRVLMISNQAAASGDRPYMDYNFRCYYTDE